MVDDKIPSILFDKYRVDPTCCISTELVYRPTITITRARGTGLLCFQRPGGYLKTFPPSLFWPAVIIPSPFPRCSFNVTSHGHFHYAQPFINSGALCRPPRPDPRPTEEGQHPSIREKRINNTQEREREQNVHQCRSPGPSLPLEGEFRKKDFR